MSIISQQQQFPIDDTYLAKSIHLPSIQHYLFSKPTLNQYNLRQYSKIYMKDDDHGYVNLMIKVSSKISRKKQSLEWFIQRIDKVIEMNKQWSQEQWRLGIQIGEFEKNLFRSQIGIVIFKKESRLLEIQEFQELLFAQDEQFELERICNAGNKDTQIFYSNQYIISSIPLRNSGFFIKQKYFTANSSSYNSSKLSDSFKGSCLIPLSTNLVLDLSKYYNSTVNFITQKYFPQLTASQLMQATIKLTYIFSLLFASIFCGNDNLTNIIPKLKKLCEYCNEPYDQRNFNQFVKNYSIGEQIAHINGDIYCDFGYRSKIMYSVRIDNIEIIKRVIAFFVNLGFQDCIIFQQLKSQINCQIQDFLSWENLKKINQNGQFKAVRFFPKYQNIKQNFPQDEVKQSQEKIIFEDNLQKMILMLKNQDFLSLKKSWELYRCQLLDLVKNRALYSDLQIQKIEQVFIIINYRSQLFKINPKPLFRSDNIGDNSKIQYSSSFSLYQYFLPDIKYIISQLKSFCHQKIDCKEYQVKNKLDKLLLNFFKAMQQKYCHPHNITVKFGNSENKLFSQFIYDQLAKQSYMSDWCDIFNTLTLNTSNILNKHQIASDPVVHAQFIDRLQFQCLPDTSCLSCTEYLIYQHNITNSFRQKEYKLSIYAAANKIRESARLVSQDICKMLNSMTGGVILFDCVKCYGGFIPYGEKMTELEKEGYQNKIKEIIASIYPKPVLGGEIIVSFVPLVIHPLKTANAKRELINYTQQSKDRQVYYSKQFMQGIYMMRIKVYSKNKGAAYIWMSEGNGNEKFQYCAYNEDREIFFRVQKQKDQLKNITPKIYKIIKLKLRQQRQISKNIFKYSHFHPLSHTCKIPFPGRPIAIKIPQQHKPIRNIPLDYQSMYNHMSMIVLKYCYLNDFQKTLREFGIKFHIQQKRFQSLKLAKYAAIMYHDQNFNKLLNIIQNTPSLYFQNKKVLTLYVTKYLMLEDMTERTMFTQEQWINNNSWLQVYLPGTMIKFIQFQVGNTKQYFIEGSTKLANVCVYFILNEHKIKTSFKNPRGIDRMTEQQRKKALKQIDPAYKLK